MKRLLPAATAIGLVVAADRLSKILVERFMSYQETIDLLLIVFVDESLHGMNCGVNRIGSEQRGYSASEKPGQSPQRYENALIF